MINEIKIICDNLSTDELKECEKFFNIKFSGSFTKKNKLFLCKEFNSFLNSQSPFHLVFYIVSNRYTNLAFKDKIFNVVSKIIQKIGIDWKLFINNQTSDKQTILIKAIINNNYNSSNILNKIIDFNPDTTIIDNEKKNALMYGITEYSPGGNVTINLINRMINLFVSQNGNINHVDKNNLSLLFYAIDLWDSYKSPHVSYLIKKILMLNPDVDIEFNSTETPLSVASESMLPLDILLKMVELSNDINKNNIFSSILDYKDPEDGYVYLLLKILDKGADVNRVNEKTGLTSLIKVLDKNFDTIKNLELIANIVLDKTTDLLVINKGISPLIVALNNNTIPYSVLEKLMLRNPDVNQTVSRTSMNALFYATKPYIPTNIFARILNNIENIDAIDITNSSALMYCLIWEPLNTIKTRLILERNPDVNIINDNGYNTLMYALENEAEDIVIEKILDLGADVSYINSKGISASILANKYKYRIPEVIYYRITQPKKLKTQVYRIKELIKQKKYVYEWEKICKQNILIDPKSRLDYLRYLAKLENINNVNNKSKKELCSELSKIAKEKKTTTPKNCVNDMTLLGDSIESIPEELVFIYNETDPDTKRENTFCFNIIELVEHIKQGNYTNPYTRQPLEKQIIEKKYGELQLKLIKDRLYLTSILDNIINNKVMDSISIIRLKATNIATLFSYISPDSLLELTSEQIGLIFNLLNNYTQPIVIKNKTYEYNIFNFTGPITINNFLDQINKNIYAKSPNVLGLTYPYKIHNRIANLKINRIDYVIRSVLSGLEELY